MNKKDQIRKTKHVVPMKEQNASRRSFLSGLWIGLGGIVVIQFFAVITAFFDPRKPRARSGKSEMIFEAGPVDQFPPETVTAFVRGKFYLARLKDGGFLALSRKCTHLGCSVPWIAKDKRFVCPCHASAFDIRGEVIRPPAPRALDIYPVKIENNIVKVETGRLVRRSEYQSNQVTYPRAD